MFLIQLIRSIGLFVAISIFYADSLHPAYRVLIAGVALTAIIELTISDIIVRLGKGL